MQEPNIFSICENSKILIVDDIETNITILHRILMMNGCSNLIETTDSTKVIELVKTKHPDVILLDLMMPVMSGFDILNALREEQITIPVIVLTALREQEDRVKALSLGAKDFISKPFDQSELMVRIKNNLETSLLYKQLIDQNTHLEEKVMERTREITELQNDLIVHLTRAIEYRDKGTGNHVTRVGLYTKHLAKLLNQSEQFISYIEYASMLHDLGKISVPDAILFKEGKFTPEERLFMERHTLYGSQIMHDSKSPILKMGEVIAKTHHEHWDGDGYPEGLREHNIPLEGRITAICDVFDALSTARRYKDAWDLEKVISELNRLKGTQFDPNLTEVFLNNIEDFVEILHENYTEEEGDFYESPY